VERRRPPRLVLLNLSGQDVARGAVALLSGGTVPVLGIAGATEAARAAGLDLTTLLRRPVSLGQVADAVDGALGRAARRR
jgi:hypothetical protein